jgi:hypothetical protein
MGNFTSAVLSKVHVNDDAAESIEIPAEFGQNDCHEQDHENLRRGNSKDLLEKIIERWEIFKIMRAFFLF